VKSIKCVLPSVSKLSPYVRENLSRTLSGVGVGKISVDKAPEDSIDFNINMSWR